MSRYSVEWATAAEAVKRTPFWDHPGLFIHPSVEGYKDYMFGMRAGPSVDLNNLAHELAHAAEFGAGLFNSRCFRGAFVFKMPRLRSAYICGQNHWWRDEMITMQATWRELRTMAIQKHVAEMMGVDTGGDWVIELAGSCKYLPDWHNVPGECDGARDEYCAEMVELLYHDFDRDEIVSEITGWLDKTAVRLKRTGDKTYRPTILEGFDYDRRPY